MREEFGKGNEFAQKITYRTTGETPERLIAAFRNSYHPRIAVTVDMIATGTDIKPLEIVMFMRAVKSRTFFEQMKGRGVRVINPADLQSVTPDAKAKDHFVIVDCVGVCERDMTDSRPMDQQKSVPLEKLLQAVALGNTEPDVLSSVAARLARLEKDLPAADQARITQAAGGLTLKDLARSLVNALAPDQPPEQAAAAAQAAIKPFSNPTLRELIVTLKQQNEQVIDTVTQDQVLEAGFSEAARERARKIVGTFEQFIEAAQGRDHRAADPLQPPDQGAADVRRPQVTGRRAARPAAPDQRIRALAGLRRAGQEQGQGREHPAHPHRPRLAGALRDAPGERAGAVPRARGRQLQGVDGAAAGRRGGQGRSPTSSAGGWRRWPSTSPPTSAWRPRTSSCRRSTSAAGWARCISSSGRNCPLS